MNGKFVLTFRPIMIKKALLITVALLFSQLLLAHKFYMSITDMYYNEEQGSLEIIIKLFTDDLEEVIEENTNYKLFLGTEKEIVKTDSLLKVYFLNQFQLLENEESMQLDFLGKEAERDYTRLYIEVPNFNPSAKHKIKHAMLTEYFENQKNQINYSHFNQVTTLNLHKGKLWAEF